MPKSHSSSEGRFWKQQDEDKIIKIRSVRSECTMDIKGTPIIFFSLEAGNPKLVALEPTNPLKRRWGC
jgi:hypothetical protein